MREREYSELVAHVVNDIDIRPRWILDAFNLEPTMSPKEISELYQGYSDVGNMAEAYKIRLSYKDVQKFLKMPGVVSILKKWKSGKVTSKQAYKGLSKYAKQFLRALGFSSLAIIWTTGKLVYTVIRSWIQKKDTVQEIIKAFGGDSSGGGPTIPKRIQTKKSKSPRKPRVKKVKERYESSDSSVLMENISWGIQA